MTKNSDLVERHIPIAMPTMAALFIEMRFNGTVISSGTGFILKTPNEQWALVTNRHNVTGRDQNTDKCLSDTAAVPNEIAIHHHTDKGTWSCRVEALLDEDGKPRWYEHPVYGAKADFVALVLRDLEGTTSYYMSEDAGEYEQAIGPAEVVSVVGYPFGLSYGGRYPIWATGFVASEPRIDHDGLPIFLIDCKSRKGQSGSIVVKHSNGSTILTKFGKSHMGVGPQTTWFGIYSGRIHSESDIGIVWKKSAILELVQTL